MGVTDNSFSKISHDLFATNQNDVSINELHKSILELKLKTIDQINSSSVSANKFGADSVARLNVIESLGKKWESISNDWHKLNSGLIINDCPLPADELLLYRVIASTYPLQSDPAYENNLKEYAKKNLRGFLTGSDKLEKSINYERKLVEFIDNIFNVHHTFINELNSFLTEVSDYGIINSISQLTLEHTFHVESLTGNNSGAFDFRFPGNETFIQTENETNYENFIKSNKLKGRIQFINELWNTRSNGRIKHWLFNLLNDERKNNSDIFQNGKYVPLKTTGIFKNHLFSFSRSYNNKHFIVALPLSIYSISIGETYVDWKDTEIELPIKTNWINPIDERQYSNTNVIKANDLFKDFPVAVLRSK